MTNHIFIKDRIKSFNTKITVGSDKSISIRSILLASQAVGVSKITNLLESDDVLSTLKTIKRLGINYKKAREVYYIEGYGVNGFNIKRNTQINAGNSGTLARLILGLLVKSRFKIKLIGDKSLSKRDFLRVIEPLEKFGAKLNSNYGKLPINIQGTCLLYTSPSPRD